MDRTGYEQILSREPFGRFRLSHRPHWEGLSVLASPRVITCLLLALSLELHLRWLGQPREVVVDEVLFGQYVTGYSTGEYFFDDHPAVGKLMIAGIAKLAGVSPSYAFHRGGAPYLSNSYLSLRLLPSLFGSLLAPLIHLVT